MYLYPIACQCGVDAERYWDMSYREISAAMKGYSTRTKFERESEAAMKYEQAILYGKVVSAVLGSKEKLPSVKDAFPSVFGEVEVNNTSKQQDWRVMKERMMNYAQHRNRGENK